MPLTKNKKDMKSVKIFALSSLLNDLGSDAIKPFWPAFVTSVIGAPVSVLGLLDGIGEVISYGVRWPVGWLSDKLKQRKIFIWSGYAIAGLSRIGYALSKSVAWLFPFKAMDRLGKLRDPPRDALLADVVPKKNRGRAFGLLTAADNFGAMLAPLFGLLLFTFLGYRKLFAIAAIPSLISVFLILFFIKEKKQKNLKISWENAHFTKPFQKFLVVASFFALSWISTSFFILYATNLKNISIYFIPFFTLIASGFSVIGAQIFGNLSDKIGRPASLFLSYLNYLLVLFLFILGYVAILNQKLLLLFVFSLFALYGLSFGAITTLQPAFIADLVKPKFRGQANGIFSVFFGFSALFASLIGGVLWDKISPIATFLFAIFLSFSSLLFYFILFSRAIRESFHKAKVF